MCYVAKYYELVDDKYEIKKKILTDLHECIVFLRSIEYDERYELASVS